MKYKLVLSFPLSPFSSWIEREEGEIDHDAIKNNPSLALRYLINGKWGFVYSTKKGFKLCPLTQELYPHYKQRDSTP